MKTTTRPKTVLTHKLDCIGKGTMKKCYAKDQQIVYVIPFTKQGQLNFKKEIAYLNFLKERDFPVVRLGNAVQYGGFVGVQEQKLQPKTLLKPTDPQSFLKFAHIPNLHDQLEYVIYLLKSHKLLIEDLQFMLSRDNRLVIIDPFSVLMINDDKTYVDVFENEPKTRSYNRKLAEYNKQFEELDMCLKMIEMSMPNVSTKKRVATSSTQEQRPTKRMKKTPPASAPTTIKTTTKKPTTTTKRKRTRRLI